MKRLAVRFCLFISIFFSVLVTALWVRSYWRADFIVRRIQAPIPPYGWAVWPQVESNRGAVVIGMLENQPDSATES